MVFRGSKLSTTSRGMGRQLSKYASADPEQREEIKPRIAAGIADFFATTHIPLEREILGKMLGLYSKKANYELAESIPDINDFKNYVHSLFELSILTSKERMLAFLEIPNADLIANDPLMMLSNELIAHYYSSSDEIDAAKDKYDRAYRMLVDGMRNSGLSPVIYPDANSTLRLTYGKVSPLPKDPRNDAKENYYTTLKGTVKKFVDDDPEFDLPQGLIDLYEAKDFGPYADDDGYMPVNFLTNNDITGGNSGSPVLNGNGELIGLAFDGNIEAMAGDVIFDDKLQKTINVDIRYVLFLIDKYAGAKHIVEEMTVIK
jgi:hypothetical protein